MVPEKPTRRRRQRRLEGVGLPRAPGHGFGRVRSAALVTLVVAAGLAPLYGDARVTPVTHPLWARMLLRSLEMPEALRMSQQASQVFSILSGRDSLALPADRYSSAEGVTPNESGGLTATGDVAELVYPLAVVAGGDYHLRLRVLGSPGDPVSAEFAPMGETAALEAFTVAPTPVASWVTAGSAHLDPGAYTASVLLPRGATFEYLEVSPPCLNPIEPPSGWRPSAVTSDTDLAVTMLKAIDGESELPPADLPIELTGTSFRVAGAERERTGAGDEPDLESRWLRAPGEGLNAEALVEVPESGLYTLHVFGVWTAGQSWLLDGCRKAVRCPEESGDAAWRPVMSQQFQAGQHRLSVALPGGSAVERVRLVRRKQGPEDYVATVKNMGFDTGPPGPISRDRAVSAMRFLQQRHGQLGRQCGDVAAGLSSIATDLAQSPGAAAGAPAAPPGGPQVPPPVPTPGIGDPPVVEPQPPSSPIQPGIR